MKHDHLGTIGDTSCGPAAVLIEQTLHAVLLRSIVRDLVRVAVFHYMLTSNFNAANGTRLRFSTQYDGIRISVP